MLLVMVLGLMEPHVVHGESRPMLLGNQPSMKLQLLVTVCKLIGLLVPTPVTKQVVVLVNGWLSLNVKLQQVGPKMVGALV